MSTVKKRGLRGPYKKFSLEQQKQIAAESGNNCEVGRRHGIDSSTIRHWRLKYAPEYIVNAKSVKTDASGVLETMWEKSVMVGLDPAEDAMPDPKRIKSVSTMYTPNGIRARWVREEADAAQREQLWQQYAREIAAKVDRVEPITAPLGALNENALAAYVVGDHHVGMAAYGAESGADYNLAISERLLRQSATYLMQTTPACAEALICTVGDFFHRDSHEAVTPQSRHLVDVDGSHSMMIRTGVRMLRHMIDAALERHGRVRVVVTTGNHDISSSSFLRLLIESVYEREPRVSVVPGDGRYHYVEFGSNLIGIHHGDQAKMADLPQIMACDQPEAWARSKYRVWWTGHIHSKSVQDYRGVSVESFRILAPNDGWAANKGYRSTRGMTAIILHKRFGEVGRFTACPEMFEQSDQAHS